MAEGWLVARSSATNGRLQISRPLRSRSSVPVSGARRTTDQRRAEYPGPLATPVASVTKAAPRPTTKRPDRFSIRGVKDEDEDETETETETELSAAEIRNQLRVLELERLEAASAGLLEVESYKRDLEYEMAERRSAFVSAAVIEIARLRAELSDWEAAV